MMACMSDSDIGAEQAGAGLQVTTQVYSGGPPGEGG